MRFSLRLHWMTALVCVLAAANARGQETNEKNLLQNGDFKADLTAWTLYQNKNAQAESVDAEVPGAGARYEQALRVNVNPSEDTRPGTVALSQPLSEAIRLNDRVSLKFWARADMPTRLEAFLFQTVAPNARHMDSLIDVGTEWKEVEASAIMLQPLDAKTHQLVLHLAFVPTSIELTGIRLTTAPITTVQAEVGPPVTDLQAAPPEGAILLTASDFTRGVENWITSPEATRYSLSVVPLKDSAYTQAMRLVTTPRPNDAPGKIWLRRAVPLEIKRGDKLLLKTWARARESAAINILMEYRRDSNAPKLMQKMKVPLTGEWQQVEVRGIAARDYVVNDLMMVFDLGLKPDTIDFAGTQLFKMP